MAYASWSVVFGEQPSAAKWNILGTNDASFNDGSGIGNDAISDAKLVNGKLYRRQGGSATVWTTEGTTTYDYSGTNVIIQSGTRLCDANPKAITFPVAFAQNPHVFVQVLTQTGANCYGIAASISTTGFNAAIVTDAGVANTGQTINWLAIGQ